MSVISVAAMYAFLPFFLLLSSSHAQNSVIDNINAAAEATPPFTFADGGFDWSGLCATGRNQSPIDVYTPDTVPVSDSSFSPLTLDVPVQVMPEVDFQIYPMYLGNNGTLSVVLEGNSWDLTLIEMHIHVPAAHLIDGVRYAMELQASFYPTTGNSDIQEFLLSLLFRNGPRSPFVDSLLTADLADFSSLLSSPVQDYFYYSGSRDTPAPDCVEPVLYVIPNQVFGIGVDQLQAIVSGSHARAIAAAGFHGIYREPQPLNGRTVYHRVPDLQSVQSVF